MLPTLLALADSRLPAGGHAHSSGAEQAVTDRVVLDEATLAVLLRRRLATSGTVAAGLAAAAVAAVRESVDAEALRARLARLDDEADARMTVAATRSASRAQGRGLVRVGRAAWPGPTWDSLPRAPHHAVTLGVAATLGGATAEQAATVVAYLSVTGPATAVQRLLGLDPVAVAAVLVSLGDEVSRVAAAAVVGHSISAESDPLGDLLTARHTPREDKLFAS